MAGCVPSPLGTPFGASSPSSPPLSDESYIESMSVERREGGGERRRGRGNEGEGGEREGGGERGNNIDILV